MLRQSITIACLLVAATGCSKNEASTPASGGAQTEAAQQSTGTSAEAAAAGTEEAQAEAAPSDAAQAADAQPNRCEGLAAPALPEGSALPAPGSESTEEILAAFPGEGRLRATLVTNHGDVTCTLHDDKVPNTVANFIGLAAGLKTWRHHQTGEATRSLFYNGLIFHRVIPNFMIQGGDPNGTGMGGPGYTFADEFHEELRHDRAGILSMANAGPNTNGSQFFVTEDPTPHLDGRHSVFGDCSGSIDVVRRIARVPRGRMDRPNEPVTIECVLIERAGE